MATRILLVDDHPLTRDALATLLEQKGFAVVGHAADGNEAIEAARALQPDLVLLDLSMPELDGLEAIPLIHQVAPRAEICIFSGFEEGKVAEVALRLKASRYVRKGAPLEDLRNAVRELGSKAA